MSLTLSIPSERPGLCCVRPSPKRSFLTVVGGDGDAGWEEADKDRMICKWTDHCAFHLHFLSRL